MPPLPKLVKVFALTTGFSLIAVMTFWIYSDSLAQRFTNVPHLPFNNMDLVRLFRNASSSVSGVANTTSSISRNTSASDSRKSIFPTLKPTRNVTRTIITSSISVNTSTTRSARTDTPTQVHKYAGNESKTVTTPTSPRAKYYICTMFTGGLGNLMFEYASTFAIGLSKNMTMIIGEVDEIGKVFPVTAERRQSKEECNNFSGRGEHMHCAYDPELLKFTNDHHQKLGLYLQSWKYFQNHLDKIRKEFSFKEDVRKTAANRLSKALDSTKKFDKTTVLVGVHIRRGDMVNNTYGYQVATNNYIINATGAFLKNFTKVIFIVCTNDLQWAKEAMPKNATVVYMKDNVREIDMAILTSCHHIIITVGSFGWWVAFLTGGTTVYYKHPVREGSDLRKQFSKDMSDYFYPGWIAMD